MSSQDMAAQLYAIKLQLLQDTGINLTTRSFSIIGEINEEAVKHVYMAFDLLEEQGSQKITINLSSHGGFAHAALAIVSRMKRSKCDVTIIAQGYVQSAATLILACGDKRLMSRLAVFMHHEGSTILEDTTSNIRSQWDQIKREEKMWNETLAQHTKKPVEFWANRGLRGDDLYLTAEQCLECGLIDKIVD